MADWEDVRRIATALPDAEESTSYGKPCVKVRGKAFVNAGREPGVIVTRAGDEDIELPDEPQQPGSALRCGNQVASGSRTAATWLRDCQAARRYACR